MGILMEMQLLLFLLASFVLPVASYVKPCEMFKAQSNSQYTSGHANYICILTQEGFTNFDVLAAIQISQGDSYPKYNFAQVANSSNFCMGLPNPYDDFTVKLMDQAYEENECDQEFTIIKTDPLPKFILPLKKVQQYTVETNTQHMAVVPRTGMWFHTRGCTGSGSVTFSGGAPKEGGSNGIHAFSCESFPDWIISFDDVITIDTDSATFTVEYSSDIESRNGRGDDLQNLIGTDHTARIQIASGETANVTVDMELVFDKKYNKDGSVGLQKTHGGPLVNYSTGSYSDEFKTDYFEIHYMPQVLRPEGFVNDDDILIQISIGESNSYCGVDKFGFPIDWNFNDIWLDIVVILDTSESMSNAALDDAGSFIESFISDGINDFLVTDTSAKFYTRVGVISMADTATTLYNLNMTKADTVQGKVSVKNGVAEIDVVEAFEAALSMLSEGLKKQPDRSTTRQVIYYMTNSDPELDADATSARRLNDFKSSGVVIVNNFLQKGELVKAGLKELASDGYYYSSTNYLKELQRFCKANCFCGADKTAYGGSDPAVQASGGCYRLSAVEVPFNKAKTNCAGEGAIIATVHDDYKGAFLNTLMDATSSKSDYFWIGYEKSDDGKWNWEDQSANPHANWDKNEPSTASVAKCAYVDGTTSSLPWGAGNCQLAFPHVCQYPPCTVGNKNC